MPTFVFGDQDNIPQFSPPGEYSVEVVKCDFDVSSGEKTKGSATMELTLRLDQKTQPADCKIGDQTWKKGDNVGGNTCYETLVLHQSCAWKIDTFCKSMNLLIGGKPPVKGQSIEFDAPMIVGLRGHALVMVDEYNGKKRNKIQTWLTNKPKLAKHDVPVEASTQPEDDIPF